MVADEWEFDSPTAKAAGHPTPAKAAGHPTPARAKARDSSALQDGAGADRDRPVIVHVVNSLDGGGTERTLVALLRAFDHSLFRHEVVTLRAAGPLAARLPDEVPCRPIGVCGRSWWSGVTLSWIARRHRAAVIHARNTGCWMDAIVAACLTRRARLVLGFHGLESDAGFSARQRRRVRWGSRLGARFASVSESGRRQLHEEADIPSDRIDVLPNGVDQSRFYRPDEETRQRARRELGFDESRFVVGIVGSLTPVKGHLVLIDAVASVVKGIPGIGLVIVGDGPWRSSLVRYAHKSGVADRVWFTGWREDVPALLACLDVYVCCSASEGMNNALLEAMATGLPVVATAVGDNTQLVRNEQDGHLIEPGSAKAIADALLVLYREPERRRRLGAAARRRAEAYAFDQTVRAYEAYYSSLLSVPTMGEPAVGDDRVMGDVRGTIASGEDVRDG